jgi:hypothetical protein
MPYFDAASKIAFTDCGCTVANTQAVVVPFLKSSCTKNSATSFACSVTFR